AYITSFPITLTTLPRAVERYHSSNSRTAPAYMLTRDTLIRPEINAYTMALGGAGFGPWPETFLYYDHECQMGFVKGDCKPHRFRSYVGEDRPLEEWVTRGPQVF